MFPDAGTTAQSLRTTDDDDDDDEVTKNGTEWDWTIPTCFAAHSFKYTEEVIVR